MPPVESAQGKKDQRMRATSAVLKSTRSLISIVLLFGNSQIVLFGQTSQKSIIEKVSTEDVKKFLDPTIMNSVLEYRFQANSLPQSTKLFTHRPYVGYSLNHWSAVWAEVPYFSVSSHFGSRYKSDHHFERVPLCRCLGAVSPVRYEPGPALGSGRDGRFSR